jgi:hypothetical protein
VADGNEQRRTRGQIEHADAGQILNRVAQVHEVFGVAEIDLHELDAREEARPCGFVHTVLRHMRLDVFVHPLQILAAIRRMPRHRDDLAAVREHAARTVRFKQCRQDLAHRQVAGSAEENEGEA